MRKSQAVGWNGMTIKDILEKVDLFNITVESGGGDSPKDEKVIVGKPPGTRVKVIPLNRLRCFRL